jgi:hypothetical protein
MVRMTEIAARPSRRQLVLGGLALAGVGLLSTPRVFAASTESVCEPQRTQGLGGGSPGEQVLIRLTGPGVFVAAAVSKQGGTNDATFVGLDVDGRNVTSISYGAARNLGLTQSNPYGLVLLDAGEVKTLTIGFPSPLAFQSELVLSVFVEEEAVVQILANVVHGTVCVS